MRLVGRPSRRLRVKRTHTIRSSSFDIKVIGVALMVLEVLFRAIPIIRVQRLDDQRQRSPVGWAIGESPIGSPLTRDPRCHHRRRTDLWRAVMQ